MMKRTLQNSYIKKQVKGIVLCVDEYGRGAEIMINAESLRNNNLQKPIINKVEYEL